MFELIYITVTVMFAFIISMIVVCFTIFGLPALAGEAIKSRRKPQKILSESIMRKAEQFHMDFSICADKVYLSTSSYSEARRDNLISLSSDGEQVIVGLVVTHDPCLANGEFYLK